MTLTACQSIHRLPETFPGQCIMVIVGVSIYMVFVLHKHWRWLINGGWIIGGIIMAGNQVLIKAEACHCRLTHV